MGEWVKMLLGVVTGGSLVLLTQWLNFLFQRRGAREQRLLDLYAEFVGVTSDDLDRAESARAALDRGAPDPAKDSEGFKRWLEEFVQIDRPRHDHRKELARQSFQIRLLERDDNLVGCLKDVCDGQPWFFYHAFSYPGGWGGETFEKHCDRYQRSVASFSQSIESLCETVLQKYRR